MNKRQIATTEQKLFWIGCSLFGLALTVELGIYLANNFVPFLIWLGE